MSLRARVLLAALPALLLAPARRDLDVGVPPGSPLEWSASYPAYTPARAPLFPTTGGQSADSTRTRGKQARSDVDIRFSNAFGQVRILTWDLTAHLEWMQKTVTLPQTGRSLRPRPTAFGDPLYWLALAPLLRLLLHPDSLSRSEVLAHLVEIGEASLPVLAAASNEKDLVPACRELRALIRVDPGATPSAPAGATPRATALARFVLEECLRDHPLDPTDDFGRRLFLFAEEAEPLLCAYAQHPSLELARNAVSALGRYETRSAVQFLAALAARTQDPVTLVRALAAIGRYHGPLDTDPLVARLERTTEPVQRAALIGALGRMGVRAAAPVLLRLGEEARKEKDSDLLIQVLAALARIAWTQPKPEIAAFCAKVGGDARELAGRSVVTMKPDVPDAPSLRADLLSQLALLARTQAQPIDERTRAELLAMARPAPLDARLSELGVGGTDPLGGIPATARFLYLEGLLRAGPPGLELLASLARRAELETALRGTALALLPYDQRTALAVSLLGEARTPVELRIQALEILVADAHPEIETLCRAQLVRPVLSEARPPAGELYLTLRALRFLSEAGTLRARDVLPLLPFVRHPPAERAAQLDELRGLLTDLAEAARGGEKRKELERRAHELLALVRAHDLDPLMAPESLDARVDALLELLAPLQKPRADEELVAPLVPRLLAALIGGEIEVDDPGRALFRPSVPLAEEVLLALGRTHDPLAIELVLTALKGAPELRAHACLALGMSGQPLVADQLLPALLDEDPFVRFCAAESLRRLTDKDFPADWIGAPAAERQAAAEAWRAWFLGEKR